MFEEARVNSRVKAISFDPAPIFIVGHWRSGTTFLHNLLSCERQFCTADFIAAVSPHDFFPTPLHRITRPLLRKMLPDVRPMDEMPLREDLPQEHDMALAAMGAPSFMNCFYFPRDRDQTFADNVLFADDSNAAQNWRESLRYYLAKLSVLNPGKRLLLKGPADSARIVQIRHLFPGALFIHVHRHPSDVLASTQRLYRELTPRLALQDYNFAHLETFIEFGYRTIMNRLKNGLNEIPKKDVATVRFDDLVGNPLEAVAAICRQFGIKGEESTQPAMDRFISGLKKPMRRPASTRMQCIDLKPIFDWLGYS